MCRVWYVSCHFLCICAIFHIFMPCFIYLWQVSHIYAMFYIFMPWFTYLCHVFLYLSHVLYIYVNLNICCITIHLCCTNNSIFYLLFSLIYVVSTRIYVVWTQNYVGLTKQIYVASRFVSSSTYSITPDTKELSSPAVARGPTYQAWSEVTRHKNEQWCANQFSTFLFVVTWGSVAQL